MEFPFPYQKEKLLSEFSTFCIGGPARYFAEAHAAKEMSTMLKFAYQHQLPVHILGKGSNTLFDDRGFNGLCILNKISFLEQKGGCFFVGSGYGFARLGGISARGGWSGLEFASGIPATVGGAIFMNAGANGKETADTLVEVGYVTEKGEHIQLRKEELEFGYRTSSFHKRRGAIVEARFQLAPASEAKARQKEILDYRLRTQPYGDPSAGCAFRNPKADAAGRLIESIGLKGMQIGGAAVSEIHANFIVNRGGATASDVKALVACVKERVWKDRGILLEEEIRYIPYDI